MQEELVGSLAGEAEIEDDVPVREVSTRLGEHAEESVRVCREIPRSRYFPRSGMDILHDVTPHHVTPHDVTYYMTT